MRFAERIYVLHAFQKKSHHGIQTAKQDIEAIKARVRMADSLHRKLQEAEQENNSE